MDKYVTQTIKSSTLNNKKSAPPLITGDSKQNFPIFNYYKNASFEDIKPAIYGAVVERNLPKQDKDRGRYSY